MRFNAKKALTQCYWQCLDLCWEGQLEAKFHERQQRELSFCPWVEHELPKWFPSLKNSSPDCTYLLGFEELSKKLLDESHKDKIDCIS